MDLSRREKAEKVLEAIPRDRCPDCGEEMGKTRTGWECLNPSCDVIQVSTKRGYGWEETRVVRRAIVIQGGNVKCLGLGRPSKKGS